MLDDFYVGNISNTRLSPHTHTHTRTKQQRADDFMWNKKETLLFSFLVRLALFYIWLPKQISDKQKKKIQIIITFSFPAILTRWCFGVAIFDSITHIQCLNFNIWYFYSVIIKYTGRAASALKTVLYQIWLGFTFFFSFSYEVFMFSPRILSAVCAAHAVQLHW